MKKRIIITETDESVRVEHLCRGHCDKDWRPLSVEEMDSHGVPMAFHKLYHAAASRAKIRHLGIKRGNK